MRSNVFINKICQIFEFNLTNNKSKKGLLWNIILFLWFFSFFLLESLTPSGMM